MTAQRSRKEEKVYEKYLAHADNNICDFCAIEKGDAQFVEATTYFKVIKNLFPYSMWDSQGVGDHLMITPKIHTSNLSAMTIGQKAEYVDLLEKYEAKGYNIYARAPASEIKSIIHQHTHLIKPAGKVRGFVFMIRKPYFRITK